MVCPYNSQSCDDAKAIFNEDDWLASTGQVGHLFDGLTYLLQAAQEWQVQHELKLGVPGYQVQVFAMDAVFLRARALFEFFIGKGRNYCHAQCLFALPNQLPALANFAQWQNELHIGAMHLQARHTGGQLAEHRGTNTKDLNKMPVDIALGILDVWNSFEQELNIQRYTTQYNKAVACRDKAKEDARQVVKHVAFRNRSYADKTAVQRTLTNLF